VNREQKEMEIGRMWKRITNADRLIFMHALSTYTEQNGSLADTVSTLGADDFDVFFQDCMDNWGDEA
jgi:hypothetical protein